MNISSPDTASISAHSGGTGASPVDMPSARKCSSHQQYQQLQQPAAAQPPQQPTPTPTTPTPTPTTPTDDADGGAAMDDAQVVEPERPVGLEIGDGEQSVKKRVVAGGGAGAAATVAVTALTTSVQLNLSNCEHWPGSE